MTFSYVLNILLVAFAFGFVIFWHELGHFLAARWAGVRVEQFAVGMGHAIFSYRKGIGVRAGNTQAEFDRRVDAELAKRDAGAMTGTDTGASLRERYDVARDLGLGETDYRFNWIPLGGYVKPTGQDDLRPAREVGNDDPKAFGAKPVGKRMVIICAGVVMNVILAFALYVALFLHGFNAPPTVVGQVLPGSPAQAAGLKAGDTILSVNGHPQHDYAKLRMNIALLRTDEAATFTVDRPGHGRLPLSVTPAKNKNEYGLPAVGVASAATLEAAVEGGETTKLVSPELDALPVGSRVVRVGDRDVEKDASDRPLTEAVNAAGGRAVTITVRNKDGSEHAFDVRPALMPRFNDSSADARGIAGLQPRVRVTGLQRGAPADAAGVKPGDVIEQIAVVGTGEAKRPPSAAVFMKWTAEAASHAKHVRLTLVRGGKTLDPIEIDPTFTVERGRRGIGVAVDLDLGDPVVADVTPDGVGAKAGVKAGERVVAVDGRATPAWADVLQGLRAAGDGADVTVDSDAGQRTVRFALSADDKATLADITFTHGLPLAQLMSLRQTRNPLEAAAWGYEETKASIFQVYVTIRRLIEGSVPLSNLSGPVGIFTAGTTAAKQGVDWLIWFTALISANLAVVNFLPIPIVDGGLFAFLVAEKVTGRPPSPRVQTAAQIVGILLLGSLFLFVTYNDILRQWG